MKIFLWTLLLLVPFTIPVESRGEYYKYTDKDGVVHFTDNMPDVPLEQKSPPINQEISPATAESTANCGGELDDTIKSCKRILRNEEAFQATIKSLSSIETSSIYKGCNLSLVQSKLTRQERELLDNMNSQLELMQRNLTQNELNRIDYAINMLIAQCEAKRTYSQKELDELDAVLRDIWEEMNKALAQNDIQKAVSYYVERSQNLWEKQFSAKSAPIRTPIPI